MRNGSELFILLYLRYMWGRWLVENVIWREGLAKNVRISSYGGGGIKLLKKPSYGIWTFPKISLSYKGYRENRKSRRTFSHFHHAPTGTQTKNCYYSQSPGS